MLHNSELNYLKVQVMPCEASASPQVKHLKASNPRSTTIILHPRSEPGTGIAHARLFESIWLFFFKSFPLGRGGSVFGSTTTLACKANCSPSYKHRSQIFSRTVCDRSAARSYSCPSAKHWYVIIILLPPPPDSSPTSGSSAIYIYMSPLIKDRFTALWLHPAPLPPFER
jgi:hypothetical protein